MDSIAPHIIKQLTRILVMLSGGGRELARYCATVAGASLCCHLGVIWRESRKGAPRSGLRGSDVKFRDRESPEFPCRGNPRSKINTG